MWDFQYLRMRILHFNISGYRMRILYIYRRHFRQSVVNMPFHPFYLHLVLHISYIQLYYTHRLYTLFTLCFIYYLYFMCILRLHPCTNRLCTFQSHNLFNNSEIII